jgi:trimeric autotransporter adhesin
MNQNRTAKSLARLIAVSFLLFLSVTSHAAIPQTISYQGMLKDGSGQLLNYPEGIEIQFAIYWQADPLMEWGDYPIWSETQTVVVKNGLFKVILGTVTPINLPFNMQYYFGVTVGTDPEMLPRQPLTTVPYAFLAKMAESAQNISGSISTNDQIVSTAPTGIAPLQISSTTMVANLNADMVDGKHGSDLVSKSGDTMSGDLTTPNLVLTDNSGIIKQGSNRLIHSYGSQNFFAGLGAGNMTLTGTYNTGIGRSALSSNSTGQNNTAAGTFALLFNSTGSNDTAFGMHALYSNTIGNKNTGIGSAALVANTTGVSNTALGSGAGSNQTTGSNNIYIGADVHGVAGESNIMRIGNGQTNAYIAGILHGDGSGLSNIAATSVTNGVYTTDSYANPAFITSLAGSKISGNIAGNASSITGSIAQAQVTNLVADLGNKAAKGANSDITSLSGLTTPLSVFQGGTGSASKNFVDLTSTQTVGGAKTFSNDITLSGNLILPDYPSAARIMSGINPIIYNFEYSFFAGHRINNPRGGYNTAVGAFSLGNNSTGNNNAALGMYSLYYNDTGFYNTAIGVNAMYSNISGYSNTAVGLDALGNNNGSYNTAVGISALKWNSAGNSNTAIGYGAGVKVHPYGGSYSNTTAIGSGAIADDSNHVKIGNSSVTQIGGQVAWSNLSDIRQKKDIDNITLGLDFIQSLRPVEFRLINGNGRVDFGFIAQEVEALLGTGYNVLGIGGGQGRTLSLRYTDFVAPLVKAIQEQQEIIESQSEKIRTLEDRLARLEALFGR